MVQSALFAQQAWTKIGKLEYNSLNKEVYTKKHMPKEYQLVSLDVDFLNNKVLSKSKAKRQIIDLPDELGKFQRFLLTETSNFEDGLQQKFPEIKSYTAKGLDDETAIAKISIGVDGFHATVYSAKKPTIYIDPFSKDNKDYIVYNRKSISKEEQDFACLVEESTKEVVSNIELNKSVNDGKLRTYRIAIVCSGEYAQFHLNRQNIPSNATDATKKAAVLSAMNTSMTRINGVFEKDLGVRMVIVNNNQNVIFLDPNTDNITDGNANTMIDEVQSICDAQIGTSNYDIGHIFSIGGDGLAGLGVVCINGQKAKGVTGISSPVNDPYDIDYVVHELGHQFGATHTQNNNCNRTLSTAVEPGSGSTIMSYAGICSPNVFGVGSATGNSDDYFHAVSIAQMQTIVNSSGNCASLSITNNATPTANAGLNYSIPVSTPFKLTGSATDADGLTTLTYNWEQIDNEVGSMPPSSTNSVGPMFRSLPAKVSPIRYFPDLSTVVGGSLSSQWEVIPSVSRDLNFAFTVRDNHVGGGSTARDDVRISVINTTPFSVTSQQSSITWNTGSSQTITWNVGTTFNAPINCKTVNIRLSTDGGVTFPILLKENTPNDGSETLIIPNHPTSTARIMVEATDNIFYSVNAVNFTINSTTPTFIVTNETGSQTACNAGNQNASYTLNYDFVNGFSETVNLSVTGGLPNGAQVSFNPTNINADGNVVMTVSNLNGVTPQDYVLNVFSESNSVSQTVNVPLKITSSTFTAINLTSPANGVSDVEIAPTLSWELNTNATSYDVQIASDSNFNNIVVNATVAANSFVSEALNETTTYYWRVRPKNSCGVGNYSSTFSFSTKSCVYCDSFGNIDYDTSTTLVNFNTINNSSSKLDDNLQRQGYFNYTSISTSVKRGDTYNLTVRVNTDGQFRTQTKVWIDWNGDCDFNDSNEEYDLGTAVDTSNGNTSLSPLSILIPTNAKLGNKRMRVSTRYTDPDPITFPTSCMVANFDGEVEDYTLIIEDETASIEDEAFKNFNLFPNPASGEFTLKFNIENSSEVILQLYDVRGRMVEEKKYSNVRDYFSEKVILNRVSSGLYLLKIINGNKQSTKKLMIK